MKMKMLRGKDLTRLGGMLGESFNGLACAIDADPVDVGVVDWLRTDPGKKAVGSATSAAWLEIARRYRESQRWKNPHLCQIATGTIPATDGKRTFVQAKAMFPGHFDLNFENFGTDVSGEPMPKTGFRVFKQIEGGTFRAIFKGFGINTRELFCSQDQVLTWFELHPNSLPPSSRRTFLPFSVKINKGTSREKEEFFVACTYQFDVDPLVDLHRFSSGMFWNAGEHHQFVFPCPPASQVQQ